MKKVLKNQLFLAAKQNEAAKLRQILSTLNPTELQEALTCAQNPPNEFRLLGAAIFAGHKAACEVLLEYGADPNLVHTSDSTKFTALTMVLAGKILSLFDLFIDKTDCNISWNGLPPLLHAVRMTDLEITQKLLAAGAKVDIVSQTEYIDLETHARHYKSETAFLHAVNVKQFELATFLLGKGADINIQVGTDKWTALHFAVHTNHLDGLRYLISKNAQLNTQDSFGRTPLHLAIQTVRNECVAALLAAGADVNIKDQEENSALEYGCQYYHKETFKLLLSKKPIINPIITATKRYTPLMRALSCRAIEAAKLLVAFGADVNAQTSYSKSAPLVLAIILNDVSLVKLMIDKKANVNAQMQDVIFTHPLVAALNKVDTQIEIIKMLLDHPQIDKSKALLCFSAYHCRLDALQAVADFCRRTQTVIPQIDLQEGLVHSVAKNFAEGVRFVHGLDGDLLNKTYISPINQSQWNLLGQAIDLAHPEMVELLLNLGAKTNYIAYEGAPSTLQLAIRSKNPAILNIVLEFADLIVPLDKEKAEDLEFLFDVILRRYREQLKFATPYWPRAILKILYFERRELTHLRAKFALSPVYLTTENYNYYFVGALYDYYNIHRDVHDDYVLAKDNAIVLEALCKFLTATYPKYAGYKAKKTFALVNGELHLSSDLLKQEAMKNLFLKEDFTRLIKTNFKKTMVNQSVMLTRPGVSASLSESLKNEAIQFFMGICKKINANIKTNCYPEFQDDDDFTCLSIKATLNLTAMYQPASQNYLLELQKRQAEFYSDDFKTLISRLKSLDCAADFCDEKQMFTIQFDSKSTQSASDWDRILFAWFNWKFNREATLPAPPQSKNQEAVSAIPKNTETLSALSAIQLLTQFIKKCLPQEVGEFSMVWCKEFVFDPPRKNNSKYRFTLNRQYQAIAINSVLIDPLDLVQLLIKNISNPKLCYLNNQNPQVPLLVMQQDFLNDVNHAIFIRLKSIIPVWLTMQSERLKSDSEQKIMQVLRPSKPAEPIAKLEPEFKKPWLLPALLDRKISGRNTVITTHILEKLREISKQIKSTAESERPIYYRAYCFYLFCLVNNVYRINWRHEEIKQLRHALRHNAFLQNYERIFLETNFLAEHSDLIIGFSAMNATLDKEMVAKLNRTEQYLTDLSQQTLPESPDYVLRLYAETLHLAALSAQVSTPIRHAATAFTSCLIYNCLKNLADFTLVDGYFLELIRNISTYVGHNYGEAPQVDHPLFEECETLTHHFRTQNDAGLGVRCLQWMSGSERNVSQIENQKNKNEFVNAKFK